MNDHGNVMESSSPRARGGDRIGSDQQKNPPNPPVPGGPMDTGCPRCAAVPGQPCRDRNGRPRDQVHAARGADRPAKTGDSAGRAAAHLRAKRDWWREHLPSLPEAAVVSALSFLWPDPDPEAVRARVVARFDLEVAA